MIRINRINAALLTMLSSFLLCTAVLSESQPFAIYEVPAISSIKRMPDQLPADILGKNQIHFIATRGEFEPASFVISPETDLEKVELKVSALKSAGGEIPAENLDIKVVKTWYQDGTAWYSYFTDPARKELVPELLLNDETLIRVDHENQRNYLRVGDEYQWINFPDEKAEKFFNYFTEPVGDAKQLQPITLKKGENKQIWVTLRVPEKAVSGNYLGRIILSQGGHELGSVKVKAHILPFELPDPKTYYNLDNPFLVTIYRSGSLEMADTLKIPDEESIEFQRRIYKNLRDHNVYNTRSDINLRVWYDSRDKDPKRGLELLKTELRLLQEAGFVTKPLLSTESLYFSRSATEDIEPEEFQKGGEQLKKRVGLLRDAVEEILGHTDIYGTSWDEAGPSGVKRMRDQTGFADYPEMKLWITAKPHHFTMAGYLFDYANLAGWPSREQAAPWHAVGAKVASYAGPHTGVENPDVYRRWEGLARYKANYDGSFNYKLYDALHPTIYEKQKRHLWNDNPGGASFRTFNMIFPTRDGIIDTIAWEGFREGIDDIRYATYLKQLVKQAEESGDMKVRHLGRKALMWLELTDMEKADLYAARLEMINYILELKQLLK